MEISQVCLLRHAHTLGTELFDTEGNPLEDSSLTATLLARKRDFSTRSLKRRVELADGLYKKVMEGKLDEETMKEAMSVMQRVFSTLPPLEDAASEDAGDSEDEYDEYRDSKPPTPKRALITVDDSLFQGLHDLMGTDEKKFLTDLMTSGEVSKLNQAAMILNGVLKLSMQPSSMIPRRSFEQDRTPASMKRAAEILEKNKKAFPLANHMPGYFVLPTFTKSEKFLNFEDATWDGAIVPPMRTNRVFEQVYGGAYQPPSQPRPVVLVKTVRGPAGRVGLRKADVVTHINELEWTGTAKELAEHIYELKLQHPDETFSIGVNSNPETARFLEIRKELMEARQREQADGHRLSS